MLSDDKTITVGNHPLIKRFMRGIYNKRPSLPRYTSVWDVSIVLNKLKTINPTEASLKTLTHKTVMLLALLSGQRVQTLQLLSIKSMKLTQDSAEFYIGDLLKQSKPGKHMASISFNSYNDDENLCIVKHLRLYLDRTECLRSSDSLLISYQKPHSSVSSETISRWLKQMLSDSGVDITVYSAHSTRAASSSAAVAQGCPIDLLMKQVGWSSTSTFARYYNKLPGDENKLDKKVLDNLKRDT